MDRDKFSLAWALQILTSKENCDIQDIGPMDYEQSTTGTHQKLLTP